MGSRKLLLIGLLLIGGIMGWYWIVQDSPSEEPPADSSSQEESVKHDFSDFELVETKSNNEAWHLTAPYSKQSGDTLALDDPQLVLKSSGETSAVITSNKGNYDLTRGILYLSGNVVIRRPSEKQVLRTEVLNWNRTEGTINTDERVDIESPRGQLSAVGMWAHLAEERMKFQSNVQFTSD